MEGGHPEKGRDPLPASPYEIFMVVNAVGFEIRCLLQTVLQPV